MKKIFLSSIIVLLAVITFAQAPEMLNYQAVVRNASGDLIKSTSVGFKISILQGTETGTAVYSETHNASTNSQGLVNLKIGNGTPTGNFANIDWAGDKYFLKVEMDPAGGTIYSHYSTTQLLSVPYALDSKNADMLDGQSSAYYKNAGNINAGTLNSARFDAYGDLGDAGRLDNNSNSDILLRYQADTMYNAKAMFYAYNSATDAITSANWTSVELNGEKFDAGNDFAANQFVAPYSGYYCFQANVTVDNVLSSDRVVVGLYVNGNQYSYFLSSYPNNLTYDGFSGSMTAHLSKGDIVTLRFYATSDASYNILGGFNYTYLSGFIISKD